MYKLTFKKEAFQEKNNRIGNYLLRECKEEKNIYLKMYLKYYSRNLKNSSLKRAFQRAKDWDHDSGDASARRGGRSVAFAGQDGGGRTTRAHRRR